MKRFCIAAFSAVILAITPAEVPAKGRYEEPSRPLIVRTAAFRGPTGLGMIRMFEDRPSLGQGVESEYTAYGSPDVLVPRLINREVEIAALPVNLAVNLYNRGVPIRLLAVIGNGLLYMVGTDESVTSLESLRGRTVQNVAKGSTPEFIFSRILDLRNLSGQVTVEFRYGHAELAQTLIAGRETVGILPEPFATKVLLANPRARLIADLQKEWARFHPEVPSYPMSVLVAVNTLIEERPGIVGRFLEEYRKSADWVAANPAEAGALAEKFAFGITRADAEQAVPRCGLTFVPAREAKPALEGLLAIFLKFAPESIGGKLPDEGFYAAH